MERRLVLAHAVDRIIAGQQSREFARLVGFDARTAWEIATAASELVSNAIKFGGRGLLRIRLLAVPRQKLELCVEDEGPGFSDCSHVLEDGYSEGRYLVQDLDQSPRPPRRGMGTGLGAVQRLMDELTLENRPEGGARVTASKWLTEI